jgi:hypothetical protein
MKIAAGWEIRYGGGCPAVNRLFREENFRHFDGNFLFCSQYVCAYDIINTRKKKKSGGCRKERSHDHH